MFVLGSLSPTYWQEVKAELPAENGGTMAVSFDMKFNRLSLEEAEQATKDAAGENERERLSALIMKFGADWKGIAGDKRDEPLAFDREGVQRVVNIGLGPAIVETYMRSLPRAKAKN
jgi:hypothetical protein